MFSYYRICSLTTEYVLLLQNVLNQKKCSTLDSNNSEIFRLRCVSCAYMFSYYRICSLPTECVLLLRVCSLRL